MTSPSPTTTQTSRRVVRGDIEGLRAVAVVTVLLYHLHLPWLPGGFAGVDVFFVISGFLITSLLLREMRRTGTISLSEFYARRARRLLPAASVVIFATLVSAWVIMPARTRPDLLADVFGATLYVVNWVLADRSVDYLAEDAAPSPLQHYWSLSVEEQFYVLWPLLILLSIALAARLGLRRSRVAFAMLAAVGAGSLGWSVAQTQAEPATAYFVTTTRLWELAAGALLAFAVPRLHSLPRVISEMAVLSGLVMIIIGMLTFSASTPWPGSAAALPVLGSVLVIAAGIPGHETLGGRVLSLPPMVWIGGLSYAIYLWHWPLVVLAEARWGDLSVRTLAALGAASVLLAWLTKHMIEDPIRFNKSLSATPWRSLLAGGATMAVLCGLALTGWVTRPSLADEPQQAGDGPAGAATLVSDPAAAHWQVRNDPAVTFTDSAPLVPDPTLATKDIPAYYDDACQIDVGVSEPDERCVYGQADAAAEVVLWGDSKLGQYFTALDAVANQEGWRLTTYLKSACAPTVAGSNEQECDQFGANVVEQILAQETPPEAVIISTYAPATESLREGSSEAIGDLVDAGITVVVLADNPGPIIPDDASYETLYDCATERPDDLASCSFDHRQATGAELLQGLADAHDLPVVDLNPWICPPSGPSCPVAIGGELVYRQGSHITDTYVRSLTPILHRELLALGLGTTDPASIKLSDVPPRSTR